MTPYFEKQNVRIFHDDARELLPSFADGCADVILTDPVWPNSLAQLASSSDPAGLFAATAVHFPRLTTRLVVHLGCDSDPRFLLGVPAQLPFFRVCWLSYAVPSYKGRLLYGGDVAYAFGAPPASRPGRRVIPGEAPRQTLGQSARHIHPCQRHLEHVRWLCSNFADGHVLDPFMGAGTTLRAALDLGLPATGIEIEERFCEAAAKRLDQGVLDFGRAAVVPESQPNLFPPPKCTRKRKAIP